MICTADWLAASTLQQAEGIQEKIKTAVATFRNSMDRVCETIKEKYEEGITQERNDAYWKAFE